MRLACTACNATLPDLPAIFEPPEERIKPKEVKCERCGAIAQGGRIACMHCDATLPRPFSFNDGDGELPDELWIAYWEFVCLDDACDECRKFKFFCFLPSRRRDFRVPIPGCKFPVCWCGLWAVGRDMAAVPGGDHYYVVEFLQQSGGAATDEQISAYLEAKRAAHDQRSKVARTCCSRSAAFRR